MNITSSADRSSKSARVTVRPETTSAIAKSGASVPSGSIVEVAAMRSMLRRVLRRWRRQSIARGIRPARDALRGEAQVPEELDHRAGVADRGAGRVVVEVQER